MSRLRNRLLAAAFLAAVASTASAQEKFDVQLGHSLNEKSSYHLILTRLSELVDQRSDGRLKMTPQCCGQLGNELRAIQAMRTGVLPGGMIGAASLEGVIEAYRVLSLPYLFDSKADAYKAYLGEFGDTINKMLEDYDLVGLGWGPIFERNVAAKRAVQTVDDMNGLKIRVVQIKGFVEAYKEMGTQPTPMPYGEVFIALQNNVIDAVEMAADQMADDRFFEVADKYSLTKAHQNITGIVFSKSFYDKLPADLQEILRTAAKEALAYGVDAHEKHTADGLDTLRKNGVEVFEPDISTFKAAALKAYPAILDGSQPAMDLLKTIRPELVK